jgi:serine protease Do
MTTFTRARRGASALALAAVLATTGGLAVTQSATPALAEALPKGGYVELVKEVAPAVALIEVEKRVQQASMDGGQMPEGFEEFARRFGLPQQGLPGAPEGEMPTRRGLGTGFIISEDGRLVTNAHVVAGADVVTVKLDDGRSFEAEIVGVDEATDLAVLKVEAEGLPTVSFGDSTTLEVGEPVIAVGNPFGIGTTVTTGIVSGLGRDINSGPFDDFIQTDAAINRGNSGGPLFNEAGEVVGVNTAILSPTGGSVGLGFSVPSELAATIVADLSDDGAVERGWLGVMIAPVSDEVAAALGLEEARGTMISGVTEESPAEEAGLTKGDIVISVDGEAVEGPRGLTRLIAGDRPGAEVTLDLLRKGKQVELQVTLGDRPEEAA